MKKATEEASSMRTWMTTKEAADHLRTTPKQIRNWVYQGRIKCYRILGYNYRFLRDDLDALVKLPEFYR